MVAEVGERVGAAPPRTGRIPERRRLVRRRRRREGALREAGGGGSEAWRGRGRLGRRGFGGDGGHGERRGEDAQVRRRRERCRREVGDAAGRPRRAQRARVREPRAPPPARRRRLVRRLGRVVRALGAVLDPPALLERSVGVLAGAQRRPSTASRLAPARRVPPARRALVTHAARERAVDAHSVRDAHPAPRHCLAGRCETSVLPRTAALDLGGLGGGKGALALLRALLLLAWLGTGGRRAGDRGWLRCGRGGRGARGRGRAGGGGGCRCGEGRQLRRARRLHGGGERRRKSGVRYCSCGEVELKARLKERGGGGGGGRTRGRETESRCCGADGSERDRGDTGSSCREEVRATANGHLRGVGAARASQVDVSCGISPDGRARGADNESEPRTHYCTAHKGTGGRGCTGETGGVRRESRPGWRTGGGLTFWAGRRIARARRVARACGSSEYARVSARRVERREEEEEGLVRARAGGRRHSK